MEVPFNIQDIKTEIKNIEESKKNYWKDETWKDLNRKCEFLILKSNKFRSYVTSNVFENRKEIENFIELRLERRIQALIEEEKMKKEVLEAEDHYKNL
ncbi:MAG TPA: hypothetical protein VHA52_09815 [Candidatus Babeliaceae bacterium]|nr:hypothetical protein [Candidatus Babeliaceae bacterium]